MSDHPALRRVFGHAPRVVVAVFAGSTMFLGIQLTPLAASTSGACGDAAPFQLLRSRGVASVVAPDRVSLQALADQKTSLDAPNWPSLQADFASAIRTSADTSAKAQRQESAISIAAKEYAGVSIDSICGSVGGARSGLATQAAAVATITNSNGTAYINNLNQQGQICTTLCQQDPHHINYFCGPAVIAEGTTTEGVGVSQYTAANYMGTTQSAGTSTTQMLNGTQHFIGYPVYGYSFYAWVGVPGVPSSSDYSNFYNHVTGDVVGDAAPTIGDADEVGGFYKNGTPFPHLVGHPNINVLHWFEIGGFSGGFTYNSSTSIYYADSATSVWTTVPAHSWIATSTLVVILGGRGYQW